MFEVLPQTVEVEGRPARIWRGGSGRVLLLIHGGIGNAELSWRSVWDIFAEEFDVIAPDLPGFGHTEPLPQPSFLNLVEWLRHMLDALGVSRISLIGNSFGASLARLFAARYTDRVSFLVLADGGLVPSLPVIARAASRLPIFEHMGNRTYSDRDIARALADPSNITPEFIEVSRSVSQPFAQTMRKISQAPVPRDTVPQSPTLVIWGAADRISSPRTANNIAASIPAARSHLIQGAGHMPQVERPEEFVLAVTEFMRSHL